MKSLHQDLPLGSLLVEDTATTIFALDGIRLLQLVGRAAVTTRVLDQGFALSATTAGSERCGGAKGAAALGVSRNSVFLSRHFDVRNRALWDVTRQTCVEESDIWFW